MSLVVKPLSQALGAEIVGVDLSKDLSAQTVSDILDAWHQYLVILFRNQSLSEDEQIRFAEHFGALQKRGRPPEARSEASKLKHPELTMLVSNIRENGKVIGSLPDGEMHFHSDFCYVEKPAKGTFLYAIEVPAKGGDTLFLNMYKAYETLPPAIKARAEGKKAVNAYHYESPTRDVNASQLDFSKNPHFAQPIVRTHPVTKRKALYVNRLMTWSVEGMDGRGGKRAAGSALRAHRAGSIRLRAQMARRRPHFVGQSLYACTPARISATRNGACCGATSSRAKSAHFEPLIALGSAYASARKLGILGVWLCGEQISRRDASNSR